MRAAKKKYTAQSKSADRMGTGNLDRRETQWLKKLMKEVRTYYYHTLAVLLFLRMYLSAFAGKFPVFNEFFHILNMYMVLNASYLSSPGKAIRSTGSAK